MSGVIYNPPDEYLNIFNPLNYNYDTGAGISIGVADSRYLKKAGDTATGIINFSSGLATADGSNGTPYGLSFINDTNTGYYRIGVDNLGISCGGVKQIDISTSSVDFTNTIRSATNGSATNPAYTFTSAPQNGMYLPSYNVLAFSGGGSELLRLQSAQIFSYGSHNFMTGSAATPSIRASSYQTTGLFWQAGPILSITAGGSQKMEFSTSSNKSYQQLNMNSNNIINAPQVGNTAGNLELAVNSTGAGGTITLTGGTDLLQGTAGGSSGQHLKLTINGVIYKIALLNN